MTKPILLSILLIGCADQNTIQPGNDPKQSAFYWCKEVVTRIEPNPDYEPGDKYSCFTEMTKGYFIMSLYLDECKYDGICNYNHEIEENQ